MGVDILGDGMDGVDPEAVSAVAGVGAEFLESRDQGGLGAVEADVVADQDEPAALFDRAIEQRFELGERFAIQLQGEELGKVTKGGIVGALIEPATAGEEVFGDEGDIAFNGGAATDEFLAAGIGKGGGTDTEEPGG